MHPPIQDAQTKTVEFISNTIEEWGIPHSLFGQEVFGQADGARCWRTIRNGGRKVSLDETLRMADAIGARLEDILGLLRVQEMTKNFRDDRPRKRNIPVTTDDRTRS